MICSPVATRPWFVVQRPSTSWNRWFNLIEITKGEEKTKPSTNLKPCSETRRRSPNENQSARRIFALTMRFCTYCLPARTFIMLKDRKCIVVIWLCTSFSLSRGIWTIIPWTLGSLFRSLKHNVQCLTICTHDISLSMTKINFPKHIIHRTYKRLTWFFPAAETPWYPGLVWDMMLIFLVISVITSTIIFCKKAVSLSNIEI